MPVGEPAITLIPTFDVAELVRDSNTDATALMTAAYHGYYQYQVVLELLQTRKISINEQNYHGMTALHMATQAGYGRICELLLRHGIETAPPRTAPRRSSTPSRRATWRWSRSCWSTTPRRTCRRATTSLR